MTFKYFIFLPQTSYFSFFVTEPKKAEIIDRSNAPTICLLPSSLFYRLLTFSPGKRGAGRREGKEPSWGNRSAMVEHTRETNMGELTNTHSHARKRTQAHPHALIRTHISAHTRTTTHTHPYKWRESIDKLTAFNFNLPRTWGWYYKTFTSVID